MQKIIGKIAHNDLQTIINEIQYVIPELMLDSYGNYMVQSLVNVCTVDQRLIILEKVFIFQLMKPRVVNILNFFLRLLQKSQKFQKIKKEHIHCRRLFL